MINCTDPRQGRTDVETVDWDSSLSWRSNVTLRCTQPGHEFYLGSGAWAVLLNLTCDQVSVLHLQLFVTTAAVTFPSQDKSWSPSLAPCHLHYCYDPPATSPDLFLTQVTAYNASDPPAHGETVRYTCNADPIAADVVHYNYINTTFGYSYVDLECGWNDSWSPATLPMCLSSKKSDCYDPDSDR